MLPKKAVCSLLSLLSITTVLGQINGLSSLLYNKDRVLGHNRRSLDGATSVSSKNDPRFDPDVLNRFLEEYANKIKRTTERSSATVEDESKFETDAQHFESLIADMSIRNNTDFDHSRNALSTLNDTLKKQKLYNVESHNENRNSGWITLDAIPWSKSKISKWQANPTAQSANWPDFKPWDKPSFNKPWSTDFPSRPSSHENIKPWQNKLSKPHWSDNSASASNKPWYSQERPRPVQQQDLPSYAAIDKYENNPNQAQKWPPERPTWDRYSDSSRPSSDIITDNGPSNFPNTNWDRPGYRPGYIHHTESYVNEHDGWNDRNDFTNNNKFNRPSSEDVYYERPHFSHYQYPINNDHPSNHPSMGDGQWVLLSTNRGYSKSRERSIKLDAILDSNGNSNNESRKKSKNNKEKEQVPALTSKRQVRLTVLPSINGTNTTTSHGGLLEVERTFKTVEQSQKEYELGKIINPNGIKSTTGILINKRPIRNTLSGTPSSSAVLAAVGAGMLPATMAMMIPMVLGRRKKRSIFSKKQMADVLYIKVPSEIFVKKY